MAQAEEAGHQRGRRSAATSPPRSASTGIIGAKYRARRSRSRRPMSTRKFAEIKAQGRTSRFEDHERSAHEAGHRLFTHGNQPAGRRRRCRCCCRRAPSRQRNWSQRFKGCGQRQARGRGHLQREDRQEDRGRCRQTAEANESGARQGRVRAGPSARCAARAASSFWPSAAPAS